MALAALKNELDIWHAALEAYDSKDFNGALGLFEQISDNFKIVMNIGFIHVSQGNLDLAIEQFTNAIKLDHYLALAYFQRGVCHYQLKNMEEALQDFSEARTMMRGSEIVHYQYLGLEFELPMNKVLLNRGLARIQLGEKSESL
ncbi:TPR-like protein, partial [Gymnopus androsaceus JB14]